MWKKVAAVVIFVLLVLIAGYATLTVFTVSESQEDVSNSASGVQSVTCEKVKEQRCLNGNVSKSDYPDSCFQNGEHILENPYQCGS